MSTHVRSSMHCFSDEILEYIEVRVEVGHGRKRPRFSLYLSSMLMYGAVRIHQKQVEHLLGEYIGPGRKSCTCPLKC